MRKDDMSYPYNFSTCWNTAFLAISAGGVSLGLDRLGRARAVGVGCSSRATGTMLLASSSGFCVRRKQTHQAATAPHPVPRPQAPPSAYHTLLQSSTSSPKLADRNATVATHPLIVLCSLRPQPQAFPPSPSRCLRARCTS